VTTFEVQRAEQTAGLTHRVRAIVALTFDVDESEIPDDISQQNYGQWTSLCHMMLLVALESEFGINFEIDEMSTITSMANIVESVQRHGA
jgi:acyl carrier protein